MSEVAATPVDPEKNFVPAEKNFVVILSMQGVQHKLELPESKLQELLKNYKEGTGLFEFNVPYKDSEEVTFVVRCKAINSLSYGEKKPKPPKPLKTTKFYQESASPIAGVSLSDPDLDE